MFGLVLKVLLMNVYEKITLISWLVCYLYHLKAVFKMVAVQGLKNKTIPFSNEFENGSRLKKRHTDLDIL